MQNRNFFYVLSIIILFLFLYVWFLSATADFPVGTIVKVEEGDSLRSVSLKLKTDHVIRSRVVFEAFVIIYGGERQFKFFGRRGKRDDHVLFQIIMHSERS